MLLPGGGVLVKGGNAVTECMLIAEASMQILPTVFVRMSFGRSSGTMYIVSSPGEHRPREYNKCKMVVGKW